MTRFSQKTQYCLVVGIVLAICIGLFGFVPYATGYGAERHPIAYWLWYFWRSPEWQHGALVPLIIGGIIWYQRDKLKALKFKGSAIGFLVIVISLLLFLIGHRSNIYYIGFASLHALLVGVVLWFGGWKWVRALAFPLCFLAFLWPLYFLESQIGFPLRMLMTDLASGFLNMIGVDHLKMGTALVSSPDSAAGLEKGSRFALEVANPCSGIRSLFALMMVGSLYGFLTLPKPSQWFVMSLATVPLAIAGNVVRILMLAGGSIQFGSEFAVGIDGKVSTFHTIAGLAVFAVALSGLFGLQKVLSLKRKSKIKEPDLSDRQLQPEA